MAIESLARHGVSALDGANGPLLSGSAQRMDLRQSRSIFRDGGATVDRWVGPISATQNGGHCGRGRRFGSDLCVLECEFIDGVAESLVGRLFKPTRRVTDPTYSEIKKAQNKFYATHELFIDWKNEDFEHDEAVFLDDSADF